MYTEFAFMDGIRKVGSSIKNTGVKVMGKVLGGDTAQGIPQAGLLDKALAAGTLASIPVGIAGMVVPGADTRAVNAMRAEDKIRESRGLSALAATPQMIKEKAAQAGQMATNTMSNNGTRVTNPVTNMRLPGELPPNSLR